MCMKFHGGWIGRWLTPSAETVCRGPHQVELASALAPASTSGGKLLKGSSQKTDKIAGYSGRSGLNLPRLASTHETEKIVRQGGRDLSG